MQFALKVCTAATDRDGRGGGKQNKVVIGCVRERHRQTFRVLDIIEEK